MAKKFWIIPAVMKLKETKHLKQEELVEEIKNNKKRQPQPHTLQLLKIFT